MQEQAERLKINAENIRSMLSTNNGQLRTIRNKRKNFSRIQLGQQKQKRAELRLEKIPLKKSSNKILKSVTSGPGDLFGKVLEFASILLFGTILNNWDVITNNVENWVTKHKPFMEGVRDFIVLSVDGAKGLVNKWNGIAGAAGNIWDALTKTQNEVESLNSEIGKTTEVNPDLENIDEGSEITNINGDQTLNDEDLKLESDINSIIDNSTESVRDTSKRFNGDTLSDQVKAKNVVKGNLFGGLAEKMFPSSERNAAEAGSESINRLFGHTTNVPFDTNNNLNIDIGSLEDENQAVDRIILVNKEVILQTP